MPLKQIHKTYRRSELALMAWRSGEVASNMHVDYKLGAGDGAKRALDTIPLPTNAAIEHELSALEDRLGPVAAKLDDSLDMRKLTGDEVMRFMNAQGIVIGGRQLLGNADPMVRQVNAAYRDYGKR